MTRKILLSALLLLAAGANAIAGSSTIGATAGSGALYDVITDGSGHFVAMVGVCDGAAAAQCASVQSNASTGTTGGTNLATVAYNYLWNGSGWVQSQPSAIGSQLSSASIAMVGASDWRETNGNVVTVQVTVPGVTTTTYGAGKEAGTLITFAAIGATPNNSGRIKGFTLTANVVMTNAWRMAFFDSNPTNSTFTDNSTPAINSADIPKERCVIRLTHANSDLGTHTIWKPLPSELVECDFSGTTGYGIMIAPDGASAALAASGLIVTGEFSYNN